MWTKYVVDFCFGLRLHFNFQMDKKKEPFFCLDITFSVFVIHYTHLYPFIPKKHHLLFEGNKIFTIKNGLYKLRNLLKIMAKYS